MMPETMIAKLFHCIKREWKFAFLSAFFIGLLTHLYRLTNFLHNWDSIQNFHSRQDTTFLGRWFLTYSCGISSYYDLPVVNGLLSLVYLALCAVCITELFHLKKGLSIFLLSAVLVTFPSVTSTFSYNFTADGYFLAMLLAAAAVLVTVRYRAGFAAGAVLLCLSYGTYQAYICFALMLVLLWLLDSLFIREARFQSLLAPVCRLLVMGAAGTALYYVILRLMLRAKDMELLSYQGIAGASLPGLSGIRSAFGSCLAQFRHFYLGDLRPSLYTALHVAILLLSVCMIVYFIMIKRIYQKPAELAASLFLLICIPFAACAVYFVSPDVEYHTLMCSSFILLDFLPVLFYDNMGGEKRPPRSEVFLAFAASGLLLTAACNYALIANIGYLYMQRSYERTYALTVQIAEAIRETPKEEPLTQIGVIGYLNDQYVMLDLPPELTGITPSYYIDGQYGVRVLLNDYFGYSLSDAPDDIIIPFVHSDAYAGMECWPSEKSVLIDGGIIYLKLDDVDW